MRRVFLLLCVAGAALAAGAGPAGAANACRGLQICVPVTGPWVVVPTGSSVPRPHVEYQLTCPPGYIVGGVDADLSRRAIDLSFLGLLGAPVTPGVTTKRFVVFAATWAGDGSATPSFRPQLGCMPSSGAGGIPTLRRLAAGAAFPVGTPTVRRVKDVDLVPGARRVTQGCGAGERLVGSAHALGFSTEQPPAAALVARVSAVRSVVAGRVTVAVRVGALGSARAVLQVAAVCAGGQ